MNSKEELIITKAVLLGCELVYDDYGHPERSEARCYHQCIGPSKEGLNVRGYGYNPVHAARDWFRRTGRDPNV